jgi:gas vesicle protein
MTDDEFSLDDDFRDEPQHEAHGTRNFIAGLAVGALLGAGFALLYAPDRGTNTRRRLGRRIRRLRDRSGESVQELKSALRKELRRVKRATG